VIPGKKYTVDDFLRMGWRRKWMILLPFVAVATGTFVIVPRLPNRYKSQTTILVVPQRVPDSYVRSTVTASIEDRLRSISEQILSRSRLELIIQEYGLYFEERKRRPLEEVIERMRSDDIAVETVKLSTTFTVAYTCNDPLLAKRVTERLASMFIEENLRDRVVLADGTSQFLESQLEDARQRLIDHEKKLEGYREQHAGELPSQLPANLQVLQNTENQVQALSESINRDRDRKLLQERLLADLQSAETSIPTPATAASPAPASAADQLDAAMAALAELQSRLKPEHPDVIRAQRAVRDLERKAAVERSQPKAAPDRPVARLSPAEIAQRNRAREVQREIENLDRQINEKQEEQKRLAGVITIHQRRIAAVPTRESELAELMRDYETLQKTYTSLLARREDSKTAADLERRQIGEQFKVLDPARAPEKPISPNRPALYALGAILGLAIGLGVTFLFEYLDTSLKTEDDVVQTLALPVLALIPLMTTAREARRELHRRRLFLSCIALGVVLFSAMAVWKLHNSGWIR
jgi:polysaccharide chain length determinant protein (PEP-CTERM system associated)